MQNDGLIGIYIVFWAKPDKLEELVAAVSVMIKQVATETGTLIYGIHRVEGERLGVSVYELYTNSDALQVHSNSEELRVLRAKVGGLVASPPERHVFRPLPNGKGLPF
jgi:quinol monooxygenase YgiN